MVSELELHLLESAIRDSRHIDVIMALDRLVVMPVTEQELNQTMNDLSVIRKFINEKLPTDLRDVGRAVFVEHAKAVEAHYLAGYKK
ncbi:hypothetical protein [Burkholderia multivorans]|uniref:hypothetical protein n=1 Tax=Burkholderia multivorans TaxID=87883 RepID=UPI001589F120|nr:hypothetical protein [Burkholderia multivorans]MDR8877262.1 hypothetical protein [Burkholderia multivorans]MDR8882478.1 hypothetical protein [Burkholderia multivorans]MDR8889461.1 hypothetical protein [Burkholderia multivorans]MDR8908215.1 hypothetical protein [Burkholderia multivorans]MDR8913923.1 hypothetical protein [Burkholderia multivorans]